jgi:hypothetical protein
MMASELTLTLQFWESLFEILESRGFIKNYMYASGVKCYPGHPWAVKLDPRKDIFLPWQTNDCLLQFLISLINILNSYLCIKVIFFVRVWVFCPRRNRGSKTGKDKRHFLAEVHINFFRRPHELQSRHFGKITNLFCIYLFEIDKFINTTLSLLDFSKCFCHNYWKSCIMSNHVKSQRPCQR